MKHRFTGRSRAFRSGNPAQANAFFSKDAPGSFFDPGPQRFFPAANAVQRKCEKCEEEEKAARPKAGGAAGRSAMPSAGIGSDAAMPEREEKVMKKDSGEAAASTSTAALAGADGQGGVPLPDSANAYFSQALGHDFGQVRIHSGEAADRSAKAIRAQAYTIGRHIVFRDGFYSPDSSAGQWLLAHELTHVVQQAGGIRRQADSDEPETPKATFRSGGGEVGYENQRDYGNCANVSVAGHTDANYSHSKTFDSAGQQSKGCTDCGPEDCVTNTGVITSVFDANPSVTLPDTPSGLTECETAAVDAFINGTLAAHEQKHVAAFNTYKGTVKTPYTYTGCASGEDAFVEKKHAAIEAARRNASNALSKKLDPFNPTIPCNCPEPKAEAGQDTE